MGICSLIKSVLHICSFCGDRDGVAHEHNSLRCGRCAFGFSNFSPTFEDCSLSARVAPRLGRQAQNRR